MGSNTGDLGFFSAPSAHQSFYHESKDDVRIDLGLSLGTSLQSQPYHPSGHLYGSSVISSGEYGEFMEWPQLKSCMKRSNAQHSTLIDDETEGVESKERWAYVKVNMEGVVVGRKVCILEHASYFSLVHQLEDMFGRHCLSGLQLLDNESEFSLFYKDKNEHWRIVGDVPWKDFVDCVKRLRIARKDEALFPSSSSLFA